MDAPAICRDHHGDGTAISLIEPAQGGLHCASVRERPAEFGKSSRDRPRVNRPPMVLSAASDRVTPLPQRRCRPAADNDPPDRSLAPWLSPIPFVPSQDARKGIRRHDPVGVCQCVDDRRPSARPPQASAAAACGWCSWASIAIGDIDRSNVGHVSRGGASGKVARHLSRQAGTARRPSTSQFEPAASSSILIDVVGGCSAGRPSR